MKIVLIVEGKSTEKQLFQYWMSYIQPSLSKYEDIFELQHDGYTIISGNGYPGYKKVIKDVFSDINRIGDINSVIISIDLEDRERAFFLDEINNWIRNDCGENTANYILTLQIKCIENWLMGNRRINIRNVSNKRLQTYRDHYNVNDLDPEEIVSIDNRSIGKFSKEYLRLMMESKGKTYSERNIQDVKSRGFFNQLIRRNKRMGHINSFKYWVDQISAL